MRITIDKIPVTPPKRGRKAMDYSIFATDAKWKVFDTDREAVRQKISNVVTGAKKAGYNVTSHLVTKKDGYLGCVERVSDCA